jgi:hypothetical protein
VKAMAWWMTLRARGQRWLDRRINSPRRPLIEDVTVTRSGGFHVRLVETPYDHRGEP